MAKEEKVHQLQMIEHNLNGLLSQRQQFHAQQLEIDAALNEMGTSGKVFKVIGNIMLSKEPQALRTELEERKEMLGIRIKNIEKREHELKEKVKGLQDEVLKSLGGKDD